MTSLQSVGDAGDTPDDRHALLKGEKVAADQRPASDERDRQLILTQLWAGISLVVFGALLLVIFHLVGLLSVGTTVTRQSDGSTVTTSTDAGGSEIFASIATSVLAIGAALIPATAAGAASSRILQNQPRSTVAPPVIGTSAISADKMSVVATIRSGASAVGVFVQQNNAKGEFEDLAVPPVRYVDPSEAEQIVSLALSYAPVAGAQLRVALKSSFGLTYGSTLQA